MGAGFAAFEQSCPVEVGLGGLEAGGICGDGLIEVGASTGEIGASFAFEAGKVRNDPLGFFHAWRGLRGARCGVEAALCAAFDPLGDIRLGGGLHGAYGAFWGQGGGFGWEWVGGAGAPVVYQGVKAASSSLEAVS